MKSNGGCAVEESRKYEIRKLAVAAAAFSVDAAVLAIVLISGWTFRLRDYSQSLGAGNVVSVLIYTAVIGAGIAVIQMPLSLYSGYILEHQAGLSRQTLSGWAKDYGIGLALGGVVGLAATELVYFLMRLAPETWWFYASVAFILFVVVMANLAPVLLLPLFFKFKPVEDPELTRRIQRLSQRTKTKLCGLFEWALGEKTRKANAAVVGWGNTRRIIVSDTLLRNFSAEEIDVIMAHELCHHVRNHVWRAIAIQAALVFSTLYVIHLCLTHFSPALGFTSVSDIANFPFVVLLATGLSLLALPGVNAFSRRLERDADLYALHVTGDALAFVSGMEKLARLNLARTSPNPIIEFVFYSHPSIEKRIRMAADRVGQNV